MGEGEGGAYSRGGALILNFCRLEGALIRGRALIRGLTVFPSFSWGIFGHVTPLDQSHASENI